MSIIESNDLNLVIGPLISSLQNTNGLLASNPSNIGSASYTIILNGNSLSNSTSGLAINLANANTWTAVQTFDNNISIGGAVLNITSIASGDYLFYNGTNIVNVIPIIGTTLTETSGQLALNLANANTWTAVQTFGDGLSTSVVNNTATQTTITGTTGGKFIATMPEQGSSYKKIIIYLINYENDTTTAQTYTYPTAFNTIAEITTNTANMPGISLNNSSISFAPDTTTAYVGLVIIEGY